jgi:hypothetical protein
MPHSLIPSAFQNRRHRSSQAPQRRRSGTRHAGNYKRLEPSPLIADRSAESCHDACCAAEAVIVTARANSGRARLVRRAFRLEYTTVAWMVVEAVVAIWSGMQARSVSLVVFGIDSLIELASAGVLIWRLRIELRQGQAFAESAERSASRLAGGLLFALAAYVVAAASW